jgi:DNA-binding winged helix-turn-helix (wHTH) protein/tetratricopeptide (TPR) repeat protein
MASPADKAAPQWRTAAFSRSVLDRQRRELVTAGSPRRLERRAFEILIHLVDRRHEIVPKSDIVNRFWKEIVPGDTALPRAIMKIRRAIDDSRSATPIIRTHRGTGYEFVPPVDFDRETPGSIPPRAAIRLASSAPRIVLLPVRNITADDSCGWVELGLMSLIGKALEEHGGLALVPVQDTFAALRGLGGSGFPSDHLASLERALGSAHYLWSELTGHEARYELHFNLETPLHTTHRGTVVGTDPARMAGEAARRLIRWLAPAADKPFGEADLDLGDVFLNQAFARALQCLREERLHEAQHLVELLQALGAQHPAIVHESTRISVALGRPNAGDSVEALGIAAQQSHSPALHVAHHSLRSTLLEQQGRIAEAIAEALDAVRVAEEHGMSDLTARLMVTCAGRMAHGFDERAEATLSQAIVRAERLSNRVVLCDAYCAAGRVAGFRNDWNSALHHQLAAVAIADRMHPATRSLAYGALSWVQSELGQLDAAVKSAGIAFRTARLSGAEPQQGLAAGQTALAYVARRRIRAVAKLYGTLCTLPNDSVARRVARDAYCRATLLGIAGQFDEALRLVDDASEAAFHHPRLLGRCQALRLRVLLQARRFDELDDACSAIRGARFAERDPRLGPLMDRALALREHFLGQTPAALRQLNRIVRDQVASEVHASISLDTAWIHLERGETHESAALLAPLQAWLEESQPGLMVAARAAHADGDRAGAVRLQQRCLQTFPEAATPLQFELLERYEGSLQASRGEALPRLEEAITGHWRIAPDVLGELPRELGGRAQRNSAHVDIH